MQNICFSDNVAMILYGISEPKIEVQDTVDSLTTGKLLPIKLNLYRPHQTRIETYSGKNSN